MCIAGGPKVLLSPQYLVSCDSDGGSAPGCGGSTLVDAWISLENGVVADSCFPYVSGQGELFPCPSWSGCFGNSSVRPAWYYAKAKSSVMLPSVAAIKASIQTFGPVSAGMDVYQDFMTYKSGVYRHVTGGPFACLPVVSSGWCLLAGCGSWARVARREDFIAVDTILPMLLVSTIHHLVTTNFYLWEAGDIECRPGFALLVFVVSC